MTFFVAIMFLDSIWDTNARWLNTSLMDNLVLITWDGSSIINSLGILIIYKNERLSGFNSNFKIIFKKKMMTKIILKILTILSIIWDSTLKLLTIKNK